MSSTEKLNYKGYKMSHKSIIELYVNSFLKHGDSDKSVFFPKGRQYTRFESLIPKDLSVASLLDYGCGLGKLVSYLKDTDSKIRYSGVDIVSHFIKHNSKKFSDVDFYQINSYQDISKKYDLIVASGTFNIISEDYLKHKTYVFDCLTHLFNQANKCLAVDFMHTQVDFQQKGAFHLDHLELIQFIEKNLTTKYILRRNYLPYEYSIQIFKEE